MLRPALADLAFDRPTFTRLQGAFVRGELSRDRIRLTEPPRPLADDDPRLIHLAAAPPDRIADLRARGEAALRAGAVAVLVLNGGLATRFGGVVKGVVPVLEGRPDRSFLAVKLGGVQSVAARLGAPVPVVVMHSFATRRESDDHLRAIAWAGVAPADRHTFVQSIFPRLDLDGALLLERPGADEAPDLDLFAAPGHGDTLGRLVESGVAEALARRGVRHLLISNVDNLGASLDPVVAGAHLEAAGEGRLVTVEAVRRAPDDVGGCIAELADGRAAIVEGFRLPRGVDPARYPHFNTNTLWLALDAALARPALDFFPVHRQVTWPGGAPVDTVHFEQLIGQVSERVPAAYVLVDRAARFLPIKTQADLAAARPRMLEIAADAFGRP